MSAATSEKRVELAPVGMEPLQLSPSSPTEISVPANGALMGRSLAVGGSGNEPIAASVASVAHVAARASSPLTDVPLGVPTVATIAEKADGEPRVIIPKSYWEKGYLTGVYYLVQYIFMSAKKQKIMDEIYNAVDEAIKNKDEVDIDDLGDAIFDNTEVSMDDKGWLFQHKLAMIAHALGDPALAQQLVDKLINRAAEEEERRNPSVR
jgi:hypothetical protein